MWQEHHQLDEHIVRCNLMRHQMFYFIKNFMSYLLLDVIEKEWGVFMEELQKVQSLDDIIKIHTNFVDCVLGLGGAETRLGWVCLSPPS